MTYQDALKTVKEHIAGADYVESEYIDCVKRETMIASMNALEKQIPRKPIKDEKQVMRYTTVYVCPSCGGVFSGTLSQYCYHCGQALDWSDYNE